MGVYIRSDSPKFWHIWLDGAPKPRINTKIPVGETAEDRKKSRRQAELMYYALMTDRARQRVGLPMQRQGRTFADHRAWYAKTVSVTKRGALKELSILRTLGEFFDGYRLDAIDHALVREWRQQRAATVKAATIYRAQALLTHLMETAVPTYLDANPLRGLGYMRVAETDIRILTQDEERRLLAALADNLQGKAIVLCALDTLLRLSNVKALQWSQDHGSHLFSDTKVKAVRIPISTRLRAALDALTKTDAKYVFPTYALEPNATLDRMFRVACTAAKIPTGRAASGVTFHSLRHTGASRMLAAGVDIEVVRQIGGWQNLHVLKRYLHPTDEHKRRAVESIAAG